MANEARFRTSLDDNVSSKLDKIRDKFNQIGGKGTAASLFGNLGAKAAAGALGIVSDAARVAVDFIGDSIKASSDLTEQINNLVTDSRGFTGTDSIGVKVCAKKK